MASPFRSRTPNPKRDEVRWRSQRNPLNNLQGSIPNTPPRSFLTEYDDNEEDCLDIRQVDHDAIINDLEIKNLSRGYSAQDPGSSHQARDPLFERQEEEEEEDDFGEYDEVEWLVNNPAAESRQRILAHNRHQPPVERKENQSWQQHILTYVVEGWIGKMIMKPVAFVLFMLFWIIKEPIIRVITFLTMIVSAVLVDPIVYLSSCFSRSEQQWMPAIETRHKIAHLLTVTMLTCGALFYLFTQPSRALEWLQQQQQSISFIPSSTASFFNIPPAVESTHSSDIFRRLAQVENQVGRLKKNTDQKLNRLSEQAKQFDQTHQKIWSAIDQQKTQLALVEKKISQEIHHAMANQLPDMLLVHTDQNGKMTPSPQFYQYLKDNLSWSSFLKHNEAAIADYMRGEMTAYLEQQKKEGAIVSKERFMKLLANDLSQQMNHQQTNHQQAKQQEGVQQANLDQLVERAIQRYHQDLLNTPDFALYSRGAFILHGRTSPTYIKIPNWMQVSRRLLGLPSLHSQPENAIFPAIYAGQCWSMATQQGTLGIMLSQRIYIQSVTIEHPTREVLLDSIDSAPQSVEFYGIDHYTPFSGDLVLLGKGYYDINKNQSLQTFDIYMPTRSFQAVMVKVRTNWGNPNHTDLYRVRFHGIPAIDN
ncbi:UNC-like C-terminal-domain-containing protein [Choanephora cucurbitarum]|nr:UNC-like C-terminal-domain-containing protein [Choanephora cucurbitarum]